MADEGNISELEQEDVLSQDEVLTAGVVLKVERLRRELSEKEVADKLHITMHYVKAIESDCYEKLPGAVFAKGYIKSYALLLELNEDEIIQLYENFYTQQEADKEEDIRKKKARKRSDRNKPWLILSAITFIGGFAALWLYNKLSTDDVEEITALPSVEAASSVPALAMETNVVEADAVEINRAVVSEVAAVNTNTRVEEQELVDPAMPDVILESEKSVQRLIAVDAAGSDILRITFSGESWVEVSDVDSNQIYRDIREAGDVLEISGNAPFNVLLGDAPFANLTLNGDSIDILSNIRIDNSARLTIGL